MNYLKIFEEFFKDMTDIEKEFILDLKKACRCDTDEEFSNELLDVSEYGFGSCELHSSESRTLEFFKKHNIFIKNELFDTFYDIYGSVDIDNEIETKDYLYNVIMKPVIDYLSPDELWEDILMGAEKFKVSAVAIVIENYATKYNDVYYDFVNYIDEENEDNDYGVE